MAVLITGVNAATLYVSPNGSDKWSGTISKPDLAKNDGPLASLAGARDAVRKLKQFGKAGEPVRVVFANGSYLLYNPVAFTLEDSGSKDSPVIYESAKGAKPVFIGGRRISGFKAGKDGIWTASIPDVVNGRWYFEQLFVNGRRAVRARTPDKGYLRMDHILDQGTDPETGLKIDMSKRSFVAYPRDIELLAGLTVQELDDTVAVVYHSWETSRHRLASVDQKTCEVITKQDAVWKLNEWAGNNGRYHLENYKQALNAPGEWFLDRSGVLYYKPLPGEKPDNIEVIAPVNDTFIQFTGDAKSKRYVENVKFRGLSFNYNQYLLPPKGFSDYQAAEAVPAAVMLDWARNITFHNCEVAHTGTYAFWFRTGCRDCSVQHSYLHDLGAGGIKIGQVYGHEDPDAMTGHITIDNNIIRTIGRYHNAGIGVWIGQSANNTMTHNDISDTYYTAISAGWTWGYGPSYANHNVIEYNHLHHIGQGVLSDMGGVYTLGTQPGTRVCNNVVHDVYAYSYGGWGLYTDEGSSNIVLENNLVYNTKTGGYHHHYGENNVVRNNIFAFQKNNQLQRTRPDGHPRQFNFLNNIIIWDEGTLLFGNWSQDFEMDNNIFFNTAGTAFDFAGLSFEDWKKKGFDKNSIIADPKFINAKKLDFRLKSDSPALKMGFKPFDYTKAGVYGEKGWVNLAKNFKYTSVEPPLSPALILNDGFEKSEIGAKPVYAIASTENKGDAIAVTDETAVSGKHSLKVTDAPGLQNIWNPHFAYQVYRTDEVTRCAFDLKFENGAVITHEWRDWTSDPYKVGPCLRVSQNKLIVDGTELVTLPTDTWIHFEITSGTGKQFTGSWDLAVTLSGQPPKVFKGLKNRGRITMLNWLGFISDANEKTAFYLDNLVVGLSLH